LIPWHTDTNHWSLFFINPIRQESAISIHWVENHTRLARRLFKSIGIDLYNLRMNIDSPQQQDIVNCGAFVALNAWKLAHQQQQSSAAGFHR
jgi:hypothetical protein